MDELTSYEVWQLERFGFILMEDNDPMKLTNEEEVQHDKPNTYEESYLFSLTEGNF